MTARPRSGGCASSLFYYQFLHLSLARSLRLVFPHVHKHVGSFMASPPALRCDRLDIHVGVSLDPEGSKLDSFTRPRVNWQGSPRPVTDNGFGYGRSLAGC